MAVSIPVAYVQQFKANVTELFQQKGSVLRQYFRQDADIVGKQAFYERIGPTDLAQPITTRFGDTQYSDMDHSRRMVTMTPYDQATLIDRQDKVRILIDPQGIYTQNIAYGLGRRFDVTLLAAMNGTAYVGETGATTSAFPAGNIIASTYGDSTAVGMNPAKVRRAKLILDDANVPEGDRVMIYPPSAIYDMLGYTTTTNTDYVAVKNLIDGTMDTWMGFKWVKTTLCPTVTAATATAFSANAGERLCFACHRSAVGGAWLRDIETRVDELPTKRYAVQVYGAMDMGAVRVIDEGVVQINIAVPT